MRSNSSLSVSLKWPGGFQEEMHILMTLKDLFTSLVQWVHKARDLKSRLRQKVPDTSGMTLQGAALPVLWPRVFASPAPHSTLLFCHLSFSIGRLLNLPQRSEIFWKRKHNKALLLELCSLLWKNQSHVTSLQMKIVALRHWTRVNFPRIVDFGRSQILSKLDARYSLSEPKGHSFDYSHTGHSASFEGRSSFCKWPRFINVMHHDQGERFCEELKLKH